MELERSLLKSFADLTNGPKDDKNNNAYLRGTAKVSDDGKYVQIDGSSTLTPIAETVDVQNGDRVLVSIENHKATIIGNLSYPPNARKEDEALNKADDALNSADNANTNSNAALEKAESAKQNAVTANEKASLASTQAAEAKESASAAVDAANTASESAKDALSTAADAKTTADTAYEYSRDAQESASLAQNEVDQINREVTNVKSNINDALLELGELSEQTETIKETMEVSYAKKVDVSEAINNVEIGGRNLLRGTGRILLSPNYSHSQTYETSSWCIVSGGDGTAETFILTDSPVPGVQNGIRIINNTQGNKDVAQKPVPLISGEQYTMSCWARVSSESTTDTVRLLMRCWVGDSDNNTRTKTTDISNTEWKRYSFTFLGIDSTDHSVQFGQTDGGCLEICGFKLEKGNKPTDWTPATEDVDKNINDTAIEIEASLKTEISKSVGELKATVAETYAAKTDVVKMEGTLQTQITQNKESINSQAIKVEQLESDTAEAQTKVEEAKASAQLAQTAADNAIIKANAAQEFADTAKAAADTATTKAANAATQANAAKLAAEEADAALQTAQADLNEAKHNLESVTNRVGATEEEVAAAQEAVAQAQVNVTKALADAATADAAAKKAQSAADKAQADADTAKGAATDAQLRADNAKDAADNAQAAADKAQEDVAALTKRVTTAETNINQNTEQIELNAIKTEEIGDELKNNYYSKTQADAAIKISSDNIKQMVSETYTTKNETAKNVVSTQEEFYLSTSSTSLAGGSWSTTPPTWQQGKYIWRRTKVTYFDKTTGYTPGTNGVCITGNTGSTGAKGDDAAINITCGFTQGFSDKFTTMNKGIGSITPTSDGWAKIKYTNDTTSTQRVEYYLPKPDGLTENQQYTFIHEYRNVVSTGDGISYHVQDDASAFWGNPNEISKTYFTNAVTRVVRTVNLNGITLDQATKLVQVNMNVGAGKSLELEARISCYVGDYKGAYVPYQGGKTGSTGTGIADVQIEFYMSTSKTTQTGGSWSTIQPTWSSGKYLWTRQKITYVNPSKTVYTTPSCDSSWEAVNNVEIGGRNLLRGTGEIILSSNHPQTYENSSWCPTSGGDGTAETFNLTDSPAPGVQNGVRIVKNTQGNKDIAQKPVPLMPNEQYTMSCWARVSSESTADNVTLLMRCWVGDSDNNKRTCTTTISNTEWKRYSFTFLAIDSTDHSVQFGQTGGGCAELCGFKIEKGNKATDWTTSSDDDDKKLNDAITESEKQITERYTSLIDSTSNEIQLMVDSLKTVTDSQSTSIASLSNQLQLTNEMAQFVKTTTETLKQAVNGKMSTSEIKEWARFDGANLELGSSNSPFKCQLSTTELAFYQGNNKVAWISNNELHVLTAVIATSIGCGNFTFVDEGELGFSLL